MIMMMMMMALTLAMGRWGNRPRQWPKASWPDAYPFLEYQLKVISLGSHVRTLFARSTHPVTVTSLDRPPHPTLAHLSFLSAGHPP